MSITIDDFTEEFLYGFLGETEREYKERVEKFVKKYPKTESSLIIDLLDLQWIAFAQQLWLIGDETGSPYQGESDFAHARLQINSNFRREHGLPNRNMRSAMMRFKSCDVLQILENAEWEPDNL